MELLLEILTRKKRYLELLVLLRISRPTKDTSLAAHTWPLQTPMSILELVPRSAKMLTIPPYGPSELLSRFPRIKKPCEAFCAT